MKIGDLVRFNHERNGGPVHRVASVMQDGMVELHDMRGYFAAHLFVAADDIGGIPQSEQQTRLPVYAKETLVAWADKIDSRLGPISGRDADALARLLRATAARAQQLMADRNDQDAALRDAIRETAGCADELAFWKFQAIYHRALMLSGESMPGDVLILEGSRVWRAAEKQLEAARIGENRERVAHAEVPRNPGGT